MYIMIFIFNDTATTEIYTLSLHDALPIYSPVYFLSNDRQSHGLRNHEPLNLSHVVISLVTESSQELGSAAWDCEWGPRRSEEHTSELQSRQYLVCRLLLEKKKILRR